MTLDADTALEPLTPTRWRGEITDRWWVVRGPFGGYVAAFLTRAMVAAVDDPARRPRSLTVHYVEAPEAGPVEVSATVERVGRSSTTVSLRLEQDGRPVALALGSCATWRDGEPEWAEAAPGRAAARRSASGSSALDPMPGFLDRFEIRPVGAARRRRGAQPRVAAARSAAPLDHLALTALSDGWMPAAFSKLGRPFGAPTVDLTIHFRAPAGLERRVGAGRLPLALLGRRRLGGGRRAVGRRRHAARPVAPAGADPRMRLGYLGLGSNVGDRRANLQAAVEELWTHGVMVLASSSVYETEPVGEVLDQREFLNACVRIETELEPEPLLDACKAVERALGREPGGVRHGPRPIDVDVLLLEGVEYESERLRLPHREVHDAALRPRAAARARSGLGAGAGRGRRAGGAGEGQEVRLAGPPLDVRG